MKEKILFDDLLEKLPNKYELTIVTGKRVRELGKGAKPQVKVKGNTTMVQVALKELMEDKIESIVEVEAKED